MPPPACTSYAAPTAASPVLNRGGGKGSVGDTYVAPNPASSVTNRGCGKGVVAAPNTFLPVMNREGSKCTVTPNTSSLMTNGRGSEDATIDCDFDRVCDDGACKGIHNLAIKKRVD